MALHRKTAIDHDAAEAAEQKSTVDPIFARAGEALLARGAGAR